MLFSRLFENHSATTRSTPSRFGALMLLCVLTVVLPTFAQNPVPFINQPLVPAAAAPGGPDLTLTVNGTNFLPGATVQWNGAPQVTTFVSAHQLTTFIPGSILSTAGTASVTVVNPGTSARSNAASFSIITASPTVFYGNASGSPILLGQTGGLPNEPLSMATGDFNGDGKLDLAVGIQAGTGISGHVKVFLGNGDGTFNAVSSVVPTGECPCSMATGDLNGDGKLDLVVANFVANTATILLGNGDGTFHGGPGSRVNVGNAPSGVAIGDFNGDGNLDVAVTNGDDNTVTILLGNGDGTFSHAPAAPQTGANPFGVGVGDFNGDGNLDLAVSNFNDTSATILLGNGDGTFTAGTSPTAPQGPAVVVGDFNVDGKLDLAFSNRGDSTAAILLGNGDGTFTPVNGCCGFSVQPSHTISMIAGDFNGDGKLDLAVAIQYLPCQCDIEFVDILLGNGDGTFTSTDFSLLLPTDPFNMVAGDFNNDGKLDFATASDPTNEISVLVQPPTPPPTPDFSVVEPPSVTVTAGNTATYSIAVSALNGFLGNVSFTCTGAPQHAACNVLPAVFMFDTETATFNLTVSTTATTNQLRIIGGGSQRPQPIRWPLALWTVALAVTLIAVPTRLRPTSHRSIPRLFASSAVILISLIFITSCGGSSGPPPPPPPNGTPPGNYVLTLQATSGSITHNTSIKLTVQ